MFILSVLLSLFAIVDIRSRAAIEKNVERIRLKYTECESVFFSSGHDSLQFFGFNYRTVDRLLKYIKWVSREI